MNNLERQSSRTLCFLLTTFLTCLCVGPVWARETDAAKEAKKILDLSGMRGGMVLHLGCGDGQLTAALRAGESFTVLGFDTDPAKIAAARQAIQSAGLYGRISVEQYSDKTLPFVSNLINLVVVEEAGGIPMNEVMRVLAPGGVACVKSSAKWKPVTKPWPDTIDQWSHFLHDSTNNAVARDELVGPPRSVHWVAPPLWLRSHETPSGIEAPISADGRLFYIFDEGLIGIVDQRLPERWALICRDAFNGKLLWKRQLGAWGWPAWNRQQYEDADLTRMRSARVNVPPDNHRRLVADGNQVYVTLAYRAPMSILDAATGKVLAMISETKETREILVSDGIAVAYTQQGDASVAQRRGEPAKLDAAFVAVDGKTKKVLWRKACPPIQRLGWAIDQGRIVCFRNKQLTALDLHSGDQLWTVSSKWSRPKTLVSVDNTIVLLGRNYLVAFDASDGRELWQKKIKAAVGIESEDLFVIDGVVWRGMSTVDDQLEPARKSANVLDIGWDLRTGQQRRRVFVKNLRSPEHHHRCYRNKVTTRYLISALEGAEFLDLEGDNHSQENWIRGACRAGILPCNGMLYVPTDQCFCEPGSKLLGFAALTTGINDGPRPNGDSKQPRLIQGPAFGKVEPLALDPDADWPTMRHDPARHGSTPASVASNVSVRWKVNLNGALSAPVVAHGKLFVSLPERHMVRALDVASGKQLWQFTANGRVDSPPTIHQGLALFGSRDGWVYCLRADDGELVWRFRAAPVDRRIAYFDQFESTWPVHGTVLVEQGIAYFAAGRSTYLDGGVRVYGVQPETGRVLHQCTLEGPFPSTEGQRDVGFYVRGANADALVAEGGFIYMRQKKMTLDLEIVDVPVLSSKGAQDVGLHVFSTSGLLDGSWYNRTFWMYSKRWPGFQLANQAPKTGQLLVVDDKNTYAIRVFYRRNVHSPMFFPAKEGYLLFADANTTEPQLVGEPGSKEPVRWLPQSDYSRGRGKEMRALDSPAFGLDKMIGYTRAEPPLWMCWLPVRMRAMVKAGGTLFVAGAPDVLDPKDPYAAFEGQDGARLVAVSAKDGKKLSAIELSSPPVFDGMIAAGGRLFISLTNGDVVCLGPR